MRAKKYVFLFFFVSLFSWISYCLCILFILLLISFRNGQTQMPIIILLSCMKHCMDTFFLHSFTLFSFFSFASFFIFKKLEQNQFFFSCYLPPCLICFQTSLHRCFLGKIKFCCFWSWRSSKIKNKYTFSSFLIAFSSFAVAGTFKKFSDGECILESGNGSRTLYFLLTGKSQTKEKRKEK